jgi:opacity protein-like surface antigen
MHVKKMIILATLAAAFAARADYETLNLYGSVGVGFGMGGKLYTSSERPVVTQPPTKINDKFYNYGGGLKLDIGCQYFMMENLALQPAFSYSVGSKLETKNSIGDSNESYALTRQLFGIKLAVVPKFEVLDLIDMYVGVGLGFFWNSSHFERTYSVPALTILQKADGKIVSLPTLGFNGILGADYPLNDKLTLFGELGFEQTRFKLKKMIIDKSTITGFDEGTYFYSKNDSQNLDPEEVPGSNFQIRFGIRYALKTD